MLIFSDKEIASLISNKFELDCIEITMTQQVAEDPLVYSGSGTIYQDDDGNFNLKLYSKIPDIEKELNHIFLHLTPGKIIGNEHYFSLSAIDMSGREWRSENIWVSGNVLMMPAAGKVVKSTLREIIHVSMIDHQVVPDESSIFIIAPGNFNIPCNESEELPNGGFNRNKSTFTVDQIKIELKKRENYLVVNLSTTTDSYDEDISIKLIQALSVVTGQIYRPIIVESSHQQQQTVKLKSVTTNFPNNALPSPVGCTRPSDIKSFSLFIKQYMLLPHKEASELFGFWHKINRTWQVGITCSSLSLVVAIEGILKVYFKEYGLPDKEILEQAKDAKMKIEELKLEKRIRNRLYGCLGQLKSSTPKNALFEMASKRYFPTFLVDEWVRLRNKSAHADETESDDIEIQKHIDQVYSNLTLLNFLMFLIIGYNGKFINYSANSWPESDFPAEGDAINMGK
jgi:hypothetical protein